MLLVSESRPKDVRVEVLRDRKGSWGVLLGSLGSRDRKGGDELV